MYQETFESYEFLLGAGGLGYYAAQDISVDFGFDVALTTGRITYINKYHCVF